MCDHPTEPIELEHQNCPPNSGVLLLEMRCDMCGVILMRLDACHHCAKEALALWKSLWGGSMATQVDPSAKMCKACPKPAAELDFLCGKHSRLAAKNPKAYYQQELDWQRRQATRS